MRSYTRSSWQVPGGLLQLEIETDRPLPRWAWERLGQLVDTLERFAQDVEGNTPGSAGDQLDEARRKLEADQETLDVIRRHAEGAQ